MEVVAEPGAGKTLGYLLPGAERLARSGHSAGSQPEGPAMLVVVPTRCVGVGVGGGVERGWLAVNVCRVFTGGTSPAAAAALHAGTNCNGSSGVSSMFYASAAHTQQDALTHWCTLNAVPPPCRICIYVYNLPKLPC